MGNDLHIGGCFYVNAQWLIIFCIVLYTAKRGTVYMANAKLKNSAVVRNSEHKVHNLNDKTIQTGHC